MSSSESARAAEDLGPQITIVSSIFITLASIATIGRFCARRLKKVSFGADDYMTLAALVFDFAFFADMIKSIQLGMGRHIEFVDPNNIEMLLKLLYVVQIFYQCGTMSVKVSLLLLYKKVFVHPIFLRVVYVVGTIMALWIVVSLSTAIANCTPVDAFWTGDGWCFDFKRYAIGFSTVNTVIDFGLWLMPIPMVWHLQLPLGQKIGLSFIFLLGLFDTAAAMTRLILAMPTIDDPDFTWFDSAGFMWSVIEISIAIICSCLPTMRLVLLALVPNVIRSYFSRPSRPSRKSYPVQQDRSWPPNSNYNNLSIASDSNEMDDGIHNNRVAMALSNYGKSKRAQNGIKATPAPAFDNETER